MAGPQRRGLGRVEGFLKDMRCKGIHKRMRRQSSPAEDGTGSMFKAGRPVGTKAPRRHAVGTVGTTWRYKSNSTWLQARCEGNEEAGA